MINKIYNKTHKEEQHEYIARIRKATTAEELNEVSLGRVLHILRDSGYKSFLILTHNNSVLRNEKKESGNPGKSQEKNEEVRDRFFASLKELKLGYFRLIGHGQEEYLKSDEDGGSKEAKDFREPYFVIPGITLEQAEKLRKESDQDVFVYSGPEMEGKLWLISAKGKEEERDSVTPFRHCRYFFTVEWEEVYL